MDTPFCGWRAASFCWNETLAGRQKPCRARQNPHQDEKHVGLSVARKGYRSYLFFPFVCLYFDNLHRNLRRFRRCVFSGFVYSPARRENCAGGERHSRRPSGALFWRAFSADERCLWAYFARNVPSLCHLQTIQRPRVRSAVLSSLLQTDRRGSHRLLSFWPRSLSNAVRFNFGRAVLSFAACPYFYSGNAVPPFGFPLSYYAGVHTETPAGSCAPQGGLCANSYVFFARLTSAFRAKPVLPLRRAGAVGCFT